MAIRRCRVCEGETVASPNIYEVDNGYIYAREVDECQRCRRRFVSGPRKLVEHLSDAQRESQAKARCTCPPAAHCQEVER